MKKILNLSLGSSKRDFTARFLLEEREVEVTRIGVDGNHVKFRKIIQNLPDIDALAIGGINSAYHFEDRSWPVKQYQSLINNINLPVYEGKWVKKYYETTMLLRILKAHPELASKRWLLLSVLDRYDCYELVSNNNINATIGDTYSALGIPMFLNHHIFKVAAKIFLPIFVQLPVKFFYPHQKNDDSKPMSALNQFDVILSETNFLLHKNPSNLKHKTIILSRISEHERNLLSSRGVQAIYHLLPGSILSANIIEAMVGVTIGFNNTSERVIEAIDSLKTLSSNLKYRR